jgi:RNA polymerase sigma-70 factor (ECF subfamily)
MSAALAMRAFVMESHWAGARYSPPAYVPAARGGPAVSSRSPLAHAQRRATRPLPIADPDDVRTLVALSAGGNAEAFGHLYDRYQPEVLRYFGARVRHPEAAQDLTQQLFLRAWQAVPRYQDRGLPFGAWLFRMAHNLAVDYYRAHRRSEPIDEIDVPDEDSTAPVEQLMAGERSERVQRALDRLSEDHRQVLVLRFALEKSAREAGEIMGRKEVTIRGLQFRALQALRAELEAGGDLP